MSAPVPLIPDSAPFTAEQRAWLNGFLAGVFSRAPAGAAVASAPTAPAALTPLTILFGSQTGSAEGAAKRAAKEAGQRGFAPTVMDMAQVDATKLATEKNLLVITSTYGDGEPPDNARALHAALRAASLTSAAAPTLRGVNFAVCGLGDTNYTQFCKCGQDFDAFLEKLGGTRAATRLDCDLDYETAFSAWLTGALRAFAPAVAAAPAVASSTRPAEAPPDSGYSRQKPYPAIVMTSRILNGVGSAKQVNHVEFDLGDSGLAYEAGDALGVIPHNCPILVADLLTALGCDGEEAVAAADGSTTSLRRALTEVYDLGKPSPDLLKLLSPVPSGAHGGVAPDPGTQAPAASPHHVIDALAARGDVKLAPGDFVRALKKLQPRLYSISSSPRAHAGQVHLTVGAVRYELAGRSRGGVCSTFLADRVVPGESRVGIFVHANRAFRLPVAPETAVIMVGPGTGIAPFRAFLHERQATGARGRNWLFFGDQRGATDFLYRDELGALQAAGVLTRLDTAFSRDQQEKVYVQHRMLAHAVELYAWLEEGAHFYVCGDAARMAKDVDAALHTVIERAGGKTTEQAAAYVQGLRTTKRYARDVY